MRIRLTARGRRRVVLTVVLALALSSQVAAAAGGDDLLDLNRASREEIRALPIPQLIADRIYEYRTYIGYFENVYELLDIDGFDDYFGNKGVSGITPEILEVLKPLVATLPPAESNASVARMAASYRQVQRFLGQEGANEGLVDEYLDMIREPVNVNELDLFDLMSYQNVSPIDATNILLARERTGGVETARQLRSTEGLRYYAFRNLRDYVVYNAEDAEGDDEVHGTYEVRYYNTPPGVGDDEGGTLMGQQYVLYEPAMTHKARFDLTGGMKAGVLTSRELSEDAWNETTKGYIGLQNKDFGPFHLKRLILGNYRVAFGLGLVMDDTDFVLFRKTGYGWNKRLIGVRPDLSRTREFALNGAAVEGRIGRFHTTLFASTGSKDVVLNDDGTANQYIVMSPRYHEDQLDYSNVVRDGLDEDIVGGNVKFMVLPGSFVGITGYEARYDRAFRADVNTLVEDPDSYLDARDSEIGAGYTSVFTDPETGEVTDHKFRRVYGAEFQTVVNNFTLQGEYATLQDPRNSFLKGKRNDAYIFNAFAQWDNLHLLGIYRDYDVGFDNPYNRAFSNDTRYEQTLLDSDYRLNEGVFSHLAFNTPQSKPEQGIFFDMRYRIRRNLILSGLQYDQWERKADGMDMRRVTIKGEYQPIFNLRLRCRHRFSSRSEMMSSDVRAFKSWESRWELHAMLSNYSRLKFMYMTSNVMFPARQRLGNTADPGGDDSALGTAGIPAHAFQVLYEHNLTPWIRLYFSTQICDGFLWNFEGNEFVLLDETGFRNFFKLESRISEKLIMKLKVTRDHNLPLTYTDVRQYGDPYGEDPDSDWAPKDQTTFRLQLDYTF